MKKFDALIYIVCAIQLSLAIYINSPKVFYGIPLNTDYYFSPDEWLYINPGIERLAKLRAVFSGEIKDLNINVYALLSNFVTIKYGMSYVLYSNIFLYCFLIVKIVNLDIRTMYKFMLCFNPVLSYLAVSYLRDLMIYLVLVYALDGIRSGGKNIVTSIYVMVLALLRPLTLVIVLIMFISQRIRSHIFKTCVYLVIALMIYAVLVEYNRDVAMIETILRIAQFFGIDAFIKTYGETYATNMDYWASIYALGWTGAMLLIFTGSLKIQMRHPWMVLSFFVILYSLVYASYLGYFVARTIYPVYIGVVFLMSNNYGRKI